MIKKIKYILLFQFIVFVSHGQEFIQPLKSELQNTLDSLIQLYSIPGANFSIYFNESLSIDLSSGYNNVETSQLMNPQDKMLAGSVGKMFFATVILKCIEEGRLGLNDLAMDYLANKEWYKDFPNYDKITIKSLLNHTSGLPRHLFQESFLTDVKSQPTLKRDPEECIQSIRGISAVHEVGKDWSYSDTNFILLGLIVEGITGKKMYDMVEELIIKKVPLIHTTPSNKRQIDGLAQGYVGDMNPFGMPDLMLDANGILVVDPSMEWTGGGYASTCSDLVKFITFLSQSDFLSENTKSLMYDAVSMTNGQPFFNGYGLGTFVWNKNNDTRYGHAGFFPGYVSLLEYSSRRQYAMAIQFNHDGYSTYQQGFLYELEKIVEKYLDRIDEYFILQNFIKQEECWNQADIECYMEAYSQKSEIKTVSRAGVTEGYERIINDYKTYFPKERMGKLHFDNISMRRLDSDYYFVSGRFNLKFEDRQDLVSGYFSVVAKKEMGHWNIITDHSS